ncbi:hypothetical protein B9Z55_020671 [Caenorhabditis nigoni]|uniref:7TM GPCR serpentine receptor class x (Srx) domain-containing protein n=1 Tax=Caenorhabditis nigoni TaxID=1611254 RepID=A0A2G5TPH7_9PELO|nr:hypothetical protein B9Z55_020671 [Caenorhabditis nigoni]
MFLLLRLDYRRCKCFASRYLFSGERLGALSVFFGWIFIEAWFMEALIQIVMSVNRFAVITLKKNDFFTYKNTLLIFAFMVVLTSFSSCCIQYLFPCCRVIADYAVVSYMFVEIEGVTSYSNLLVFFYDIICLIIPTICYGLVFRTIRNSNKNAPANVRKSRNNQEVKYLIQFVFISFFYLMTWMTFFILPLLVPNGPVEWYSIVPIFVTLNCSSNAVIFLSVNREIRKALGIPWLQNKIRGMSTVPSSVQVQSISRNT